MLSRKQLNANMSDPDEMMLIADGATTANDRRSSKRFKFRAPLTVIARGREIPAYTRDLSGRGVYFNVTLRDSQLIESEFDFLIDVPSEITLTRSCRIRCRGKLVRKEVPSKNLTGAGFAAEILDYSILSDLSGTDPPTKVPTRDPQL
jgi:hypothetical protein